VRAAATSPAWAGELVSASTSSGVAISETPVPSADATWPSQRRRKSGFVISRELLGRASGAFSRASSADGAGAGVV
jgi:hypothetical protein